MKTNFCGSYDLGMRVFAVIKEPELYSWLKSIHKFNNLRLTGYVYNTLAWCEQKWPKTTAIFPLESNPRSSLLTSRVSVRFSVHTTQESVTKTYPICDSAASLRHKNRSEIRVLCVNESPIRYVVGAGTGAIRYSVDRALNQRLRGLIESIYDNVLSRKGNHC